MRFDRRLAQLLRGRAKDGFVSSDQRQGVSVQGRLLLLADRPRTTQSANCRRSAPPSKLPGR